MTRDLMRGLYWNYRAEEWHWSPTAGEQTAAETNKSVPHWIYYYYY